MDLIDLRRLRAFLQVVETGGVTAAALLGTGAWHWASWTSLTLLLVVIVRYWAFPLKH